MRTGSIIYATDQGLGILAKSFVDNGIVTDVAVIAHGRHETHWDWYPNAVKVNDLRRDRPLLFDFCASMDAMLFFETPFVWELIPYCRSKGVKTALMPMHECLHQTVRNHLPDLFLCPSELDLAVCRQDSPSVQSVHVPVPVEVPWRKRERAEVFVHNAGHGGLKGRNGTAELFAAFEYVKSPVRFIVRSQERLPTMRNYEVEVDNRIGNFPYESLWEEGDVFIFPEKFNGLSLPLQEARAAGMLVMATNRFPMDQWLPKEPLIPSRSSRKNRIGPPYREFDEAIIDPRDIAATIDAWYGRDITEFSQGGREWALQHSWDSLRPRYLEALS